MNIHYRTLFAIITFIVPTAAGAQTTQSFDGLLQGILDIIWMLMGIVYPLAFLVFFWGTAMFIWHAGDTEGISRGKKLMWWGGIALFVLTSLVGIFAFLGSTVGVDGSEAQPTIPTIVI